MSTGSLVSVPLLIFLFIPVCTAAQQPADSARAQALRDFHGPDLKGKDGPLAKAGLDLLTVYHRYQHTANGASFEPDQSGIRVRDGYVVIDAIATSKGEALRRDLDSLGLENGATAGRVVSGRFPIDAIPQMAKLKTLRGAMPSQARTHNGQGAQVQATPKLDAPSPSAEPSEAPTPEPTETSSADPGTTTPTVPDSASPDSVSPETAHAPDSAVSTPSEDRRDEPGDSTPTPEEGSGLLQQILAVIGGLLLLAVLVVWYRRDTSPSA